MLINLRNALMAGRRLPYDAEVEYLESTGTQWIDTGVVPTNTTGILIECTVPTNNSRDNIVVGTRQNSYDTRLWIDFDWSTYDTFYFGFGSLTPRADNSLRQYEGERVQVGMNYQNGRICTVNGEKFSNLPISGSLPTITKSIYCFRANYSNPYTYSGKIFSLKITDGLTLVRDYIPVRKGAVGYLYDRVSGKLFGNAGSGDFVLGPDVVPVEYIKSTGTQRILTDIYTDANTAIKCKASGTSGSFFGVLPSSSEAWWTILPNSGKLRYYYGGSGAIDVATIDATIPHDYQCSDKVLVDGVEAISLSKTLGSADVPLSLFARTASSGTSFTSLLVGRMWYLQIIQSGATVRNFRPVRVGTDATSWEGAMMDVLTRRIYRNAGTGAFTYGNDLKYPIPA